MSISISSEVLGTLSVTVAETTGVLSVSVLATAPAVLSMELGTPGPAATIAVGTTTTLSPGSSATVTNAGTSLAAILNFGIPQGIQGVQGPAGPAGSSGIVYATAPLSYNAVTQTISIDLSAYETVDHAAETYYPVTNPAGYLTTADLSDYATQSWVTSQGYLTDAPSNGYGYTRKNGAWSYTPKFYSVQVGEWTNITSGQYLVNDGSFVTNITAGDIILSDIAGLGMRLTNTGILFPDATTQTTAGISSATAAATYAVIAAAVPVGGSTGQVLTKTSGTDYALSWETPVIGDRYLTSSTTSNSVSNGNKTFTIGTGLSYTPTQNITISFDASNHMHGEVLTYNSGTGVLTVDIKNHTGSGTYTSWVVNVGGVTPATSVAWGAITGTLSTQTDLQTALDLKATLESPTFTTRIYTPAIRNILNTDLVVDAYNDTGAGTHFLHNFNANDGRLLLATNGGGLTFPDATTQTTAGIPDAPSDGTPYVRLDGAWEQLIIT